MLRKETMTSLPPPPQALRHKALVTCLCVGAASLALSSPVQADPSHQDWTLVDRQTQQVAGALGRTAAPIDRRIKLSRCPEQPSITAMNSSNLAVRCASLGWRLRVAMLDRSGSFGGEEQSSYFAPSTPTAQRTPASPPLIRRGDMVRISIETPSYSVSYPATAIQDGRMGDAISLRGADPKNPILAVVAGPGRAVISR